MLHEATRRYIMSLADQQLVEYVQQGTEAVEPEALAFAQAELHQRGHLPQQLQALTASARASVATRELQIADAAKRPLSDRAATWFFVAGIFALGIWPLLLFLIAWSGMRSRGEYRKIREMRSAVLSGFLSFWVALLVVGGGSGLIAWLLDLPGWW